MAPRAAAVIQAQDGGSWGQSGRSIKTVCIDVVLLLRFSVVWGHFYDGF